MADAPPPAARPDRAPDDEERGSALDLKVPPPIVAALVAVAMWGAAPLGPTLPIAAGLRVAMVGVLLAAGVAFDLLGLWAFRSARTTIHPMRPQRTSTLVTGGVYRVTRNPMYVGLCCLLLAWAAYLGALLPLAGPLAFVAYITRFQIRPEERVLVRRFGAQFSEYAARVRRWL